MAGQEDHIQRLLVAELQFRLASAVRLAVTAGTQPIDLPVLWSQGRHVVGYEEVALRQNEADYAAFFLHRSATYLMAAAMKDALRATVSDPKSSPEERIRSAYQISRLVRNAFAHAPFSPTWSIDPDCRDTIFVIPDLVTLDTTGLHGRKFDWRHYGGPLALFRLCQFVRTEILQDRAPRRRVVPSPDRVTYQQGDLILERVEEISPGAVLVESGADGQIDLGGGHVLRPRQED